jgi:hypothetical protein
MSELARYVADVPDFPRPGILFRDIAPLLREHFDATMRELGALLSAEEWASVDAVAGIESRGFILGAALAARCRKGFVLIRKQGKLLEEQRLAQRTQFDLEMLMATGMCPGIAAAGRTNWRRSLRPPWRYRQMAGRAGPSAGWMPAAASVRVAAPPPRARTDPAAAAGPPGSPP